MILRRRTRRPPPVALPTDLRVDTADGAITIPLATHPRARRLSLRVDVRSGGFRLVAPIGMPLAEIERFASAQRHWLEARRAATPARVPLAPGNSVPILGVPHRIVHDPEQRAPVTIADGVIAVGGAPEHAERRIRDHLQSLARRELGTRAHGFAERLGRKVARVRLGDPRTRWGSCNSRRVIAFSWRLILAPEPVMTYVVAHEVAHLVELNHGAAFWKLVAGLVPEVEPCRAWLARNAGELHRYG